MDGAARCRQSPGPQRSPAPIHLPQGQAAKVKGQGGGARYDTTRRKRARQQSQGLALQLASLLPPLIEVHCWVTLAMPSSSAPLPAEHQGDKAPSATCPAPGAEQSPCPQAGDTNHATQPGGCPRLTSTYLLPSEMGTLHISLPPCSLHAPLPHSLNSGAKGRFFPCRLRVVDGRTTLRTALPALHCKVQCATKRSQHRKPRRGGCFRSRRVFRGE